MATIDVWAARMLRRAANMIPGASFDRIPPPAEQGVSGTWNADATKVTGAFGFGAEVMQKVSDNLAKKGIIVAPPDLQAIAWFAEKELWGKKGWTTKTGEGGSFEENIEAQPTERFIAGHSVQIGSNKPQQKTVLDAQKRIQDVLDKDKGVLAYRVMQTSGLYGNEVEASFDTEIVADKGQFDPEELIKELASISKKNKQWDIFVSRVIGVNEESENARPGVEIYFKTPQDMAKIMPVLDRFTSKGQDGFTLAVDPRAEDGTNQYIGVRLQYVPEISMRWDEDLRQELLVPGGLEKVLKDKAELLENIAADVSMMDGIAYASVASYDTVVIGKENYDDYIGGRVTEEDQTAGSQPWFGQPVRSHVERAVTRLQGYQGQVGEGGVSGVGEKPSPGEKLSLRSSATPAFKQWFGDSKVADENGEPLVVYHGTSQNQKGEAFTFFDTYGSSYGLMGMGAYFTDNPEVASSYTTKGKGDTPTVYPVFLSIKNPLDMDAEADADAWISQFDDIDQYHDGGTNNESWYRAAEDLLTDQQIPLYEGAEIMQDGIRAMGFDGITHIGGGRIKSDSVKHRVFIAFEPTQIKSATGNIGTYDPNNPDIRYSLRTSFPSAKEAENAAYDKAPPSTKEFKLFFGGSTIMDEGRPQPMYHGSASGFDTFSENKPIFVSPDPDFAEQFAEDRAKDEGKSTDEMRIYPLWVRAETPFDYENSDHVAMVADKIVSDQKLTDDNSTVRLKKSSPNAKTFRKEISKGLWSTIEDPTVQDALKFLGFDSFYVQEQGNKNLAVFKAEQVKSITGNIGDFSRESKDMRFSLKKVRYSDDRFESLLNSSTTTNTGEEKTAKKYLAFIDPLDFVKATSSYRKYKSLQDELEPVDFAKMRELGPITLEVGAGKDGEWNIKGHEGRHRMLALSNAGYRDVPVVLDFGRNVKDAAPISGKFLRSQEDDSISRNAFVYDIEPLSIDNTDRARSKFTRLDSKPTKYSLPTIPQQITDRIDESVFKRQEKGFVERMVSAISPESAASFRQRYLNRYNQMSVYDKKRAEQMGGAALLADQSAESAALMSDLGAGIAASAMGMGDRNGGIPVLRNGITTIDTNTKGMIASVAPLAAYGDPVIFQRYQYWAMVKRGQRLNKEGKLTGIDSGRCGLCEDS
jgi:hypothetical protein